MKNIILQPKIQLFSACSGVGIMENDGKLGQFFDFVSPDDRFGEVHWEAAEIEMVRQTVKCVLDRADVTPEEVDFSLGGDLMNQCVASSFGILPHRIPHLGLYGACATFAEALLLSSVLLSSGHGERALAFASSHYSSAERQYRFPLEYGCQRPSTAQRTVTGCGVALLSRKNRCEAGLCVTGGRVGRVCDSLVKDANNMGAAMAPAAAETLADFLAETRGKVEDYDLILTGDLGKVGAALFCDLCREQGILLGDRYRDCGMEIYDDAQDVHAGASGAGCSAIFLCGFLKKAWRKLGLKRILFLGTGALLSPTTVLQKRSIPSVAHLVLLEACE